ncbi:hypothetical protein [Psychrobacter aestuarii]|uniref:HMA domain-containing protein n=1 Tax=Psychrobacter aestuarii TaxID=556327 RepID=A0ABP3FDB0_9GAMM|nr:hypothetical protein [Psychrobacter aestuarii]
MSVQRARVDIHNIDDDEGRQSVIEALHNITGVMDVTLVDAGSAAEVHYDDTKTSIHALTAAISMVDYVTQPYPVDAPQNSNT